MSFVRQTKPLLSFLPRASHRAWLTVGTRYSICWIEKLLYILMFHSSLSCFVQLSLPKRHPRTVSSRRLTSCNLGGIGQGEALARDRWVGRRWLHGNCPSHFLPAVVLPVVAFCCGNGSCQDILLRQALVSGTRKNIPFLCPSRYRSGTSSFSLLLILWCLWSLHQSFNPVQSSVKSSSMTVYVNSLGCVICFL